MGDRVAPSGMDLTEVSVARAASLGDEAGVRKCLQGMTDFALWIACLEDRPGVAGVAMEMGASLESAVDGEGTTPLCLACRRGSDRMVTWLIARGAAVDARTRRGETPLSIAAGEGHVAAARALLDAGACPDGAAGGRVPIVNAAMTGSAEAVDLLLSRGADFLAFDGCGRSAVTAAAERGRLGTLMGLLARGGWSQAREALLAAARAGHVRVVDEILSTGRPIGLDDRADGGETVLDAGGLSGSVDVVRSIVGAGARAAGPGLCHAVSLAAAAGDDALVGRLLTMDTGGLRPSMTPALCVAARNGSPASVSMLLSSGADPNGLCSGRTPLTSAVAAGRSENVAALLQAGAGVDVPDLAGRTPLFLCLHCGPEHGRSMQETASLLLRAGAMPPIPVDPAAQAFLLPLMRSIIVEQALSVSRLEAGIPEWCEMAASFMRGKRRRGLPSNHAEDGVDRHGVAGGNPVGGGGGSDDAVVAQPA